MLESKKIVEGYLNQSNWRVKENSNAPYSFGALNKHISSEVSKDYWLRHVYPNYISQSYLDGEMHIHDLGALTIYCCGYSLERVIKYGVKGVPNIPTSAPAKHFSSILNQLSNLITVFQNEIAGAVAFSSVDTLLAPFIKKDNLSYDEVVQHLQNFIFSINSNSRMGAEPAFSNITIDLTPPRDMIDKKVFIANTEMEYTYRDCQKEMDMFNKAFCELMIKGDSNGKPFAYPIPTYNIHERFDWENPNNDLLWDMAGKYGYPYFANFINSDMKPEDARSMCCRLKLDLRELDKKNGGLFGAGEGTGSIGVVTLNLPHIGYISKTKDELFENVSRVMSIAKDSLEMKRGWLEDKVMSTGLLPAYDMYVGTMNNHFSTIGYVGLNEMCENFLNKDILSDEGKTLSLEILEFMRERLKDYQEETGNLFNLEASPSESTAYRLAKKDLDMFGDIKTAGTIDSPYYTNSCHIPVNKIKTIHQLFEHQNDLQIKHTGGTVIHIFLGSSITGEKAKQIVKTVCEKYEVPYVSLSPINRYCDTCGYIEEEVDICPKCGKELDQFQRITGYLRNIKNFNIGKAQEFKDRAQL